MDYLESRKSSIAQLLRERGYHGVGWANGPAYEFDTPRLRAFDYHLGQEIALETPISLQLLMEPEVKPVEFVNYISEAFDVFKRKIGLTPIDVAKKLTGWPVDPETTKVIEHPAKDQHREPRSVFNIPGARVTQIEMKKYQNDSGFSIWLGYDRESDILVWCPGVVSL